MESQSAEEQYFVSEQIFKIILWVCMGLCVAAFAMRLTIRFICFQRLFAEDYLMIIALFIIIAIVTVLHLYLSDIYLTAIPPELTDMSPEELAGHLSAAWQAIGAPTLLYILGTWIIKANFMLFFYRLGNATMAYKTLWWVAAVFTIALAAIQLGIIPYDCVGITGDVASMQAHCATKVGYFNSVFKASAAINVISDFIIIMFPIVILWNAKISLRQKLVLSSIFSLVALTIAVTIVRGAVSSAILKSVDEARRTPVGPSWTGFWFFIELIVSFLIACLVSFRALWTNKRLDSKARRVQFERQQALLLAQERRGRIEPSTNIDKSGGVRSRWSNLLDTLADLEGTTIERDPPNIERYLPRHLPLTVPSGRLVVDFSQFGINQESASDVRGWYSSHSSLDSFARRNDSLARPQPARQPQASALD